MIYIEGYINVIIKRSMSIHYSDKTAESYLSNIESFLKFAKRKEKTNNEKCVQDLSFDIDLKEIVEKVGINFNRDCCDKSELDDSIDTSGSSFEDPYIFSQHIWANDQPQSDEKNFKEKFYNIKRRASYIQKKRRMSTNSSSPFCDKKPKNRTSSMVFPLHRLTLIVSHINLIFLFFIFLYILI